MPSSMKQFQMLVEISAILVSSFSSEYLFSNSKVITVRKRSMNWSQFKHPISHMYLPCAAVVSWSLTQEVVPSY